jgi:hydrogenase nickel incorporation protein HypA/HybF
MHELPVTQNLLDLALEHAQRAGGGRITALDLVIGDLSGIVDDSVRFYWEFIAADTPAAGSELRFRRVALELHCRSCARAFTPEGEDYRCPGCGGGDVTVISGREFYLESIDLQQDGAEPRGDGPRAREESDG